MITPLIQNIIAISSVVLIMAGVIAFIVCQKRKGVKCIGCPYAKQCSKNKNGGCSCKK